MDKKQFGLLGSMLCSLTVILIVIYLISYLSFNSSGGDISLTSLLGEMENSGMIKSLTNMNDFITNLKIPKIEETNTLWSWLNPVISSLNLVLGFFTTIISFMSVIIVFMLACFSLV